jgi:glycosyltransferase involved in cell wall biosynthesis
MIGTPAARRLRVAMFVGTRERCGIGEYSRALVEAMAPLAEVTPVAGTFGRCPAAEHRRRGVAMNAAEIAHIQHAYAFFGGMAPHRAGFPAFLRAIRRPIVMTVHELDDSIAGAGGLPAPVERLYKRLFNRITFGSPRIAALIVHAAPLQRGLLKLGIPSTRIHCLPMPVPAVTPAADGTAYRARWELADQFVVTIFGFLARRKGYEVALDALTRLPADVCLMIAGDAHPADPGDPRAWLRQAISTRGLDSRVRLTGYVPDEAVSELMAASDLVLAPFTAMSASASLHLALAYGRPVLASDLEANRDLPCVELFPAGDTAALAGAIAELRASPGRRVALAEAALTYGADHGMDRLARETVTLYQDVLAHAHRH